MNFFFARINKVCHFDRNEPTILLFRFLLRNRSVHGAEKPLFDSAQLGSIR